MQNDYPGRDWISDTVLTPEIRAELEWLREEIKLHQECEEELMAQLKLAHDEAAGLKITIAMLQAQLDQSFT